MSTTITTRQTRGTGNRKPTEKYELFQQSKKQISPKKSLTPEKAQIEILEKVLDKGTRLVKNTQLGLEMQKSNMTSCSNVSIMKGLMPKRIMSTTKRNTLRVSKKTPEKIEEAPKIKSPKDRSALVGLKRNRKSRDQIQQL